MSALQGKCPSCAGPLEFKAGAALVIICPHCRSAVARTDRGLESLGKVAEIIQSESPLRVGLKGTWRGYKFEITGRVQNRHELGGIWDEWFVVFSNGWIGWLAEAQGRFYLTFYQKLDSETKIPDFENLHPGQLIKIKIPKRSEPLSLTVNEKGVATAIAAEGEIPYNFKPNQKRNFADLQGLGRTFATLDYETNPPTLFLGEEVTLKELDWDNLSPASRDLRTVSTVSLNCPNCAAPLKLEAPDKTERVACPYCDSLLDVSEGKFVWLKSITKIHHSRRKFVLDLGMQASLKNLTSDEKMKIVGSMVRSVTIRGITYYWHEYLLYNPKIGFRWLVHSDNHWNFVEPANPAEVYKRNDKEIVFRGKTFKIFQDAEAVVEYVRGEFYWKVEQGERVRVIDYVAPPLSLSCELTKKEVNWSLGHYLPVAEVEKAFKVQNLPRPINVAPNQPFTGDFYIKWGFASIALLILIAILMIPLTGFSKVVLSETLTLRPSTLPYSPPQVVFSKPFNIESNKNISITARATVDNSWVELDVDLINNENEEIDSVTIPIEYYHGVEEGESWSEGSRENEVVISSLPSGIYMLRVEAIRDIGSQPISVDLVVRQNVTSFYNLICAFIMLSIVPVFTLIKKYSFEHKRWSESMFPPSWVEGDE